MKQIALVIWPSLITALVATAAFFSIFDPVDQSIPWKPLGPSTIGFYMEAYLLFWAFGAASSAMTLFLQVGIARARRLDSRSIRTKPDSRRYDTQRRST